MRFVLQQAFGQLLGLVLGVVLLCGCGGGGSGPSFSDSTVRVFNGLTQNVEVQNDGIVVASNLAIGSALTLVLESGPHTISIHPVGSGAELQSAVVSASESNPIAYIATPAGGRIDTLATSAAPGKALVRFVNGYGSTALTVEIVQGSTILGAATNVTIGNPVREFQLDPGTYTCRTYLNGSTSLLASSSSLTVGAGNTKTFVAHQPGGSSHAVATVGMP